MAFPIFPPGARPPPPVQEQPTQGPPLSEADLDLMAQLGVLPGEQAMAAGEMGLGEEMSAAPLPEMHGRVAAHPLEFAATLAERIAGKLKRKEAKEKLGETFKAGAKGRGAFLRRFFRERYGEPPPSQEELTPPREM